jgi:hypothetical protein
MKRIFFILLISCPSVGGMHKKGLQDRRDQNSDNGYSGNLQQVEEVVGTQHADLVQQGLFS